MMSELGFQSKLFWSTSVKNSSVFYISLIWYDQTNLFFLLQIKDKAGPFKDTQDIVWFLRRYAKSKVLIYMGFEWVGQLLTQGVFVH